MKICLISNLYPPDVIGGAELYVSRIAEGLSNRNQVFVITSGFYKNYRSLSPVCVDNNGVKIYTFSPLNFYHISEAKKKRFFIKPFWRFLDFWNPHAYFIIKKILNKENPDVVHTHNLRGFSLAAITACKKAEYSLVHTCHDFSLLCPYSTLTCPVRKEFCFKPNLACQLYRESRKRLIDNKPFFVIFPSESTKKLYLQGGFFKNNRIGVIPYCLKNDSSLAPKRNGSGTFNILYVGQLTRHKGVQVLINAFKNIKGDKFRLNIVGDGDYRNKLVEISKMDSRIFFKGKISNEEVYKFYSMADVTIVPSLWPEVLGIVILESLSMGAPVIGSDIGGIREVIKNGYNGFLFNAGSVENLRNILINIAGNPLFLDGMRENALISSKAYGIDSHIVKLEEIYKNAIKYKE